MERVIHLFFSNIDWTFVAALTSMSLIIGQTWLTDRREKRALETELPKRMDKLEGDVDWIRRQLALVISNVSKKTED